MTITDKTFEELSTIEKIAVYRAILRWQETHGVAYDESLLCNQELKADAGKLDYTTVPTAILFAIATVRAYGIRKYGEKESWRKVGIERYRAAAYRHWLAYLEDPTGCDEESGIPHLYHLACNIAFLCDLQEVDYE